MEKMSAREALTRALNYYIIADACTKYDPEIKVKAAKSCLKELEETERVSESWIRERNYVLQRVVKARRLFLDRIIKAASPLEGMSEERSERRTLAAIANLFIDFLELPL